MITLRSYDDLEISDEIELPDMAELINWPWFYKNDIEYCYKNANSDVKNLLDQLPLRNDRKYISVQIYVQYISPNVVTVPRASWHYDSILEPPCHTHLLITQCSSMTKFSENSIRLPQFNASTFNDHVEIEKFMNHNSFIFKPKDIPANRIVTFSGLHPHTCTRPTRREFRFMFRVVESDVFKSNQSPDVLNTSYVYIDNVDQSVGIDHEYLRGRKSLEVKSIEKTSDGKVILYNH